MRTTMPFHIAGDLILILVLSMLSSVSLTFVYRACGGHLTNSNGVIQSPNFPNPFPTPIRCEWVIHNTKTTKTVIYFTQYYLKGNFYVWEYDHYTSSDEYVGANKLSTVNFQERVNAILSYKPFVVIQFSVSDIGNIHARVLEHLIDVYGFNITYEFMDRGREVRPACSLHGCSYLGNCYATADFSDYHCACFEGYFGKECQFGPHCDPQNGINICYNDGKCRYFQGSFVNMCNCTERFTGDQCLIPKMDFKHDVCKSLGCDHSCDANRKTCICKEGFRLLSDNRTCSYIERNNVFVTIFPTTEYIQNASTTGNFPRLGFAAKSFLQLDVEKKLHDVGIKTMTQFRLQGFSLSQKIVLSFRFRIEIEDTNKLVTAMNQMGNQSKIGNVVYKPGSLRYSQQPELYLKAVVSGNSQKDNYGNYATEGKFLTLSCIARGPTNTKFVWYKDNKLIRLDLSTRDGYQTIIPSSREKTIRSVLHFESVVPLDRGQFTCQVSDSIASYNGSVYVDVISYPLVDIDPLAGSVSVNGSTNLICLSPHDTLNTFKYEWYENGFPIKEGRSDKIPEDLIPTGSLLYVRYLEKSAKFTCKVTNPAGEVNVTSSIYVQPPELSNETCDQEYHDNVFWRATAGRHFDKQRCPAEAGDIGSFLPIDVGYATRRCSCNKSNQRCYWEKPNFSECQSLRLVRSYDKLENLRLGYQQTTVKQIYDELEHYSHSPHQQFYSGDSEMAASILRKLLQHMTQYPELSTLDQRISFSSIVSLMDLLLEFADNATYEEKESLHVSMNILGTYDILATDLTNQLKFSGNVNITSLNIDVHIGAAYSERLLPDGAMLLRLPDWRQRRDIHGGNKVKMLRFTSRKIASLLSLKNKQYRNHWLLSDIFSVLPFPSNNFTQTVYADLDIPVRESMQQKDLTRGEFACVAWASHERDVRFQGWDNSSCIIQKVTKNMVTCRCELPGHFVLTFLPEEPTPTLAPHKESETVLGFLLLGSAIFGICGAIATLIILVYNWRKLVGAEYISHINFLIALLCLNGAIVLCLSTSSVKTTCIITQVLLYMFFLTTIAFLFTDCIHNLIVTKSKHGVGNFYVKYLLIGWGIPAIVTVFFIVASELLGRSYNCLTLCWIERNHWQFYGFLVPVVILLLSTCAVSILSYKKCVALTEEAKYKTRKKILMRCSRSLLLMILLIVVAFLAMDLHSHHLTVHAIFLVIFLNFLTISVFIIRGILDEQLIRVQWTCFPECMREETTQVTKGTQSNSSFRAYIKPEKLKLNEVCNQQVKFNKHYEEVNRNKYTSERKRHLSSLLGSSTSGYMMDSAIGGLEIHRDAASRSNDSTRETNCTDSGVGSENDKFLGNSSSDSSLNVINDDGTIVTFPVVHAPDYLPMKSGTSLKSDKRLYYVADSDYNTSDKLNDTENIHDHYSHRDMADLRSKYDDNFSPEESSGLLSEIAESVDIVQKPPQCDESLLIKQQLKSGTC